MITNNVKILLYTGITVYVLKLTKLELNFPLFNNNYEFQKVNKKNS